MPASCAGRCSWSTKMNGAEAMKAYIEAGAAAADGEEAEEGRRAQQPRVVARERWRADGRRWAGRSRAAGAGEQQADDAEREQAVEDRAPAQGGGECRRPAARCSGPRSPSGSSARGGVSPPAARRCRARCCAGAPGPRSRPWPETAARRSAHARRRERGRAVPRPCRGRGPASITGRRPKRSASGRTPAARRPGRRS